MTDVYDRITEYVLHGGLYNPELMQHDKVRDLLIDCRAEIARLRLTDAEREAVETCILGLVHPEDSTDAAVLRGLLERTK